MKIIHISDVHCTQGIDFNEKVFDKAVHRVNEIPADFVFVSGDLTTEGLLSEYELAHEKLASISHKKFIVPGNHDERNLGYKLFPKFFGETDFIYAHDEMVLIGLASSEPDKDTGRLGYSRHRKIEQGITQNKCTIIGFHHHVIPVPNSGRETNIIDDAGETLDILLRQDVPLVLMGHRHVPWAVKIHKTLFVNAGTFSCNRTRAYFGNTFNIIDIIDDMITVHVVDIINDTTKKMIEFNINDGCCINKYYDATASWL